MTFRDNPDDPTLPPSGDTASSSSADSTLPPSESPETLLTSDSAPSSSSQEDSASSPKTIGPYRLVRKLGEGGMGQVWLAEQTAPLQRLVAIKLIRAGVTDNILLERFESERQALARMNHPAKARADG